MVYYRNYRYNNYNKGYKYKYKKYNNKKKFSRFNTYKNRNSKAQAYQIYSLNNKINTLMKRTKPEALNYTPADSHYTISFASESNSWYTTSEPFTFTTSTFSGNIKNKTARINKVVIAGTLERENGFEQDTIDRKTSGYALIAVLQTKQERSSTTTPTQIFDTSSGPLSFKKPLQSGASTYDRILKIIRVKLTDSTKNIINFKKTIKVKFPIYRKPISSDTYGKGHIYVITALYQDFTRALGQFTLNLGGKIVFTDA